MRGILSSPIGKRCSCSTENNRQTVIKKLQETLLTINKRNCLVRHLLRQQFSFTKTSIEIKVPKNPKSCKLMHINSLAD